MKSKSVIDEIIGGCPESEQTARQPKKRVFLVHGRSHVIRDQIELFLRKDMQLDVEVMESGANLGSTLPEKFERAASTCSFAVLLFTADDVLRQENGDVTIRARQNVILECGYFWGRLGRSQVAVLVEKPREIELPTDLDGVAWIPITEDLYETKEKLRKELSQAGVLGQ
jgi:predicted nucleotide-binding protein